MRLTMFKNTVLLFVLMLISCGSKSNENLVTNKDSLQLTQHGNNDSITPKIIVGANRTAIYLPFLEGKRVGIVANQTSVIFKINNTQIASSSSKSSNDTYTHLVDSLISLHIDIKKVFAPEHGFRGTADAGEVVKDGIDTKTGLPIISLYGKNKKPSKEQLKDLDIVVFDIQDVGARFYTYISSLHYVMEACAEQGIDLIILDRPNPNGHFIDGPILEPDHKSFVGMHAVPVVHGMTMGEYAQMVNGEQWLDNRITSNITVINMQNYTHQTAYSLPIKPSPNLPNDRAINLYPSLCFFEGTNVSAGRGTSKQFQIYGSPYLDKSKFDFNFTPKPNHGSKYPKHDGTLCYGEDLSDLELRSLDLSYLIKAYQNSIDQSVFFNDFFTKLAGTKRLQEQIEQGFTEADIKASWKNGLMDFEILRKKYLIYN